MNIFGLCFTFTLPGIIIGMMIMAAIYAELAKRRRKGDRS